MKKILFAILIISAAILLLFWAIAGWQGPKIKLFTCYEKNHS